MPDAAITTPPPPAAAPLRIGEMTVEVGDESNRSLLFGPTQTRLRGRWDWANLARGETSESGLTKMPVIPGMYLTVSVRQRLARVEDPLGLPENRGLLMVVGAVHASLWNYPAAPVDTVTYEGLTDDQLATWLYWLWRGLSSRQMRLIVGSAFTLEDLAAQFPRAKIRRQFYDSLGYKGRGSGDSTKQVALELGDE